MHEEVKGRLRKYRKAKEAYFTAKAELEECETMIIGLGVDYTKERVQRSQEADKLGEIIDRLSLLRSKSIEAAEIAAKDMETVKELIHEVKDERKRDILVRYYLQGMTWEQIAVEKKLSWTHLHRLHGEALEELSKK